MAEPQAVITRITGLHTYNSELSSVPPGSLKEADDISLNRQNIAEPRRGFDFLEATLSGLSTRAKEILFYLNETFVHTGTELFIDDGASFVTRGAFAPPNGRTVKSAELSKNLYLTSSTGILKLDNTTDSAQATGCPKGLFIETADTGASGFLPNTEIVAYRYIICKRDANSNLIRGGVSGRTIHTCSTAPSANVAVTCYIPAGLTTSHFIQLYRTGSGSTEPNDEMQLAAEVFLTSTDITNGYVPITDIAPDELLGATLYTSPSQQGITQDNAQPPIAKDLAEYKQHVFYANTTSKHRLYLTLIAAGGTGLIVDDTVTIAGQVYTAKAVFNQGSRHFIVDTASVSAAVRIDNTVRSLIKCINGNASSTVYAYLLSGELLTDLPGKMLLEERSIGGSAFTALSSRGVAWNPVLDTTAGVNQTSTNDTFQNAVMYSKMGEGEAVPLANIRFIGSANKAIRRIKALRDGLFIFKDDGLFVIRGEDRFTFQTTLLDGTAHLIADNSVADGDNQIFGLCDIGAVKCTDTGVTIISGTIKDKFVELYGLAKAEMIALSYGATYETEGKYLIALPLFSGDTYCKQIYCYDYYGETWTRWLLNVTTMQVNPVDDLLYLGVGDSNEVKIERKTYDYSDFADFGQDMTITSASGTTLGVTGADEMAAGDMIIQGDNAAFIESVDTAAQTVVVDIDVTWSLAAAEHYKGITPRVTWNPQVMGNPAAYKQFVEAAFLFKRSYIGDMQFIFSTDESPSDSAVTIEGQEGSGDFGSFDFGDAVFGGDPSTLPTRVSVPRNASRGSKLNITMTGRVAFSDWQLEGVGVIFNEAGTRVTRGDNG